MQDFVRVIWKHGHESWAERIRRAGCVYNEAELKTVADGVRRAATLHVSQENIDLYLPRLNSMGLIFTPLRKSGYYQGFAHHHKEVKAGDPYFWYGCVTRNNGDALRFKEADVSGDHLAIGNLLGFPSCCTQYFTESFPKDMDPVWVGRDGEITGYPECNQMLRYFGLRITSHLSCSPDCRSTRELGSSWIKTMRSIDDQATTDLLHLLSQPFTWDSYHGVVQVDTQYFVGLTHTSVSPTHRNIKWSVCNGDIEKVPATEL